MMAIAHACVTEGLGARNGGACATAGKVKKELKSPSGAEAVI